MPTGTPGGVDRAEPASVLRVVQRGPKAVERRGGDRPAPFDAEQGAEGVDVHGPAGDPGVHRSVEVGCSLVVEPRGTAGRVDDAAAERQQASQLRIQPVAARPVIHSGSHAESGARVKKRPPPDPLGGSGSVVWQVEDSNLCRRCRLIYSQLPLAARATCRAVRNNSKARTPLRIAGAPRQEAHQWLTRASTS